MELYEYQKPLVPLMESVMNDPQKKLALLALSTGVGKTVVALYLMSRANCSFGILAPKITLGQWKRTAKELNVEPKFLINPEAVRTGNRKSIVEKKTRISWNWTGLKKDDWIILDEIHRFAAPDSQLAYMAASASAQGIRILGLSATLADSPLKMRMLLHAARLTPWRDFYHWAKSVGCYRDTRINGHPWRPPAGRRGVEVMEELNQRFFPGYGVRLDAKNIPNYPKSQVIVDLVTPSPQAAAEAKAAYALLRDEIRNPEKAKTDLTRLLRYRQQVEHAKVPVLIELAEDGLADGNSVVCAFNFTEPMEQAKRRLAAWSPACIYGTDSSGRSQSETARQAEIDRFQSNQTRVLLLMIQAGGVGLSLQDSDGNHPRLLLTNLPLDTVGLLQVLGRCARANSKSPTVNRVVLLDGVAVEEKVFRILNKKVGNLSALQNDDLNLEKLVGA